MKTPRLPVWLPYVQSLRSVGSGRIEAVYNGGKTIIKPKQMLSLLVYGECDYLPVNVLEEFQKAGVPVVVHRRNMITPLWITPGLRSDKNDVLTAQIFCRNDDRKRAYISRMLISAKNKWTEADSGIVPFERMPTGPVKKLRDYEAKMAKVYWADYFEKLKKPEWSRRAENPVKFALDAASKFAAGITLRWITYHHLSPYHGFLHEPSDYPSLVYDLLEPYRYILHRAVREAHEELQGEQLDDRLLPVSINRLKELLHEEIFCVQTRQYVRRQELLHGAVLALRAYLLGLGKRFVIPMEGVKNGGRPMKTNYTLPGKSAGYSRIYKPC